MNASALAPGSIGSGAVISYSGDALVVTGGRIIELVQAQLLQRTSAAERHDRWLAPGVPALSRGDAWIVPLFWSAPSADIAEPERKQLDTRASELGQDIMSACWYVHGDPISVDFEGLTEHDRGYGAELVRTGAKSASWWQFDNVAVVLVYYGEPSPAPKTRMALQVVPLGWVSTRRPTPAKKMSQLNLAWSWADAVAFAAANSAGSLAEQSTEGSD